MRSKLIFLLAVVFGLAAAALAFFYLDNAKKALDQIKYVEVVAAARDIPADTTIQPDMLTKQKKPADLKHPMETVNPGDLNGKILTVPITAGESILTNQVYAAGDKKKGLAYLVPKGKRAITIGVDDVSGLAGMLKPGDHVDVLATVDTYTILPIQDVTVLAVGQVMDENQTADKALKSSTVTLAVQYNDAKPLMLATKKGSIQLLLRSPVDHDKGYYGPYRLSDLIKGPAGGNSSGKD